MKKFESPKVEIVRSVNSDIITTSGGSGDGYDGGMSGGDNWEDDEF